MLGIVLMLVSGTVLTSGLSHDEVRLKPTVSTDNNRSSPENACVGVVGERLRSEIRPALV